MFQISEDSLQRLLTTSAELHLRLTQSPLWNVIKDEPVIANWIAALTEIDIQVEKKVHAHDETINR